MEYSLDTIEDKLTHIKITLYDLAQEQRNKGNFVMFYVLQDLDMIASNALVQLRGNDGQA